MRSAQELLDELNASDESPRIEAKRASEMGKSLLETVIAFANEPGLQGGWLFLGVSWTVNEKGDRVYVPEGIPDPDKVQADLATQCANMLNLPIRPEIRVERFGSATVLTVYIAEVDPSQKPVYLKATGLPKGAFRRIGSTDQRCTEEDIWVLRGDTQPQHGPDQAILNDARLDDIDPVAVQEYRRVRASLNPRAEELAYGDQDLLEALGAIRPAESGFKPTVAGIVLFGKSIALRRLLPMVRIDYIRVVGNEWVEDPEHRFQSIDIRKPLLLALPTAEASIVDDLPKGFILPEGDLHSRQDPLLPRKVIREALANAVMHRNYLLHSPIQIIRYSNRIEIRNVGHSLKEPGLLGSPGSRLRNPTIAAVLHDLNLAEAKGTGIRAMRRLATEAGLPLPEFRSDRQANEFLAVLHLHNLLTEEDHLWLQTLTTAPLSAEEAKVLVYARGTGAVDNEACRDFCGLDTLAASSVLRRLRDRGLLEKQGAGNRTYYVLEGAPAPDANDPHQLDLGITAYGDSPNPHMLAPQSPQVHMGIPTELLDRIAQIGAKPRQETLRKLLLDLCALRPFTAAELGSLLGRTDPRELTRDHLKPMREAGQLVLRYPESAKHPHQAYLVPGTTAEFI